MTVEGVKDEGEAPAQHGAATNRAFSLSTFLRVLSARLLFSPLLRVCSTARYLA